MVKIKNKGKLKNKNALEFVLVNRGMDDPNYNNPDAPSKILLHVPKEEETNKEHTKLLNQIPEISRGIFTEKAITNNLKELGINCLDGDMNYEDLKRTVDRVNSENLTHIKSELTQKKNMPVNTSNTMEEEIVDTKMGKSEIDDRKIDEIFKHAKVSAKITEYNKFGLRNDIDPEVLNFITDKEFVEGVDVFIPAPQGTFIQENRFDIDIPVETMDEEYKEVYDAMLDEGDSTVGEMEQLEDDFVLIANEGVIPIKVDDSKTDSSNFPDELVLAQTENKLKNPSYKFITKEEKDYLDSQINKVEDEEFEDFEYNEEDDKINENKPIEEEEEEEEEEEIVEINEEDELHKEDESHDDTENKFEFCENNFKIEYEDKKQNKKGGKKKPKNVELETFTVEDLDVLVHDEMFVQATIELFENNPVEEDEKENEGLPVFYPKKRHDITMVHGKVGYLPKTIGEANVKLSKEKLKEMHLNREEPVKLGKTIVISSNKPLTPFLQTEESKDDKKLRKKLIKEEKKEKRKQKKELKVAFQTEKTKIMKNIANTNQVIRYGLSVKEI